MLVARIHHEFLFIIYLINLGYESYDDDYYGGGGGYGAAGGFGAAAAGFGAAAAGFGAPSGGYGRGPAIGGGGGNRFIVHMRGLPFRVTESDIAEVVTSLISVGRGKNSF